MIVLDASAVLELLLRAASHDRLVDRVFRSGEVLAAPHLLDLEVAQVLRRFVAAGELSEQRARAALNDYADIRIARYPHDGMLKRIWELRHNCTAYDAAYIALAESLGCPLITFDRPLAAVPGQRTTVELFTQ
ncbi:MAG: type II toxin-antitoxin system VapC family toxin [Planctomycetota bacterium]